MSKLTKGKSKHMKDRETHIHQPTTSIQNDVVQVTSKIAIEDNVWSEQLQIEDDKPREDDFEDYLEQLLF